MMGDACICVDIDSDYYIDWGEEEVTDDKTHKCAECKRTIPAGAPHVLHSGQEESEEWDTEGDWDTEGEWVDLHRECLCCAHVRRSLFECGWFVGRMWSDLRNHMDDVMPIDEDDDGDESWCDPPTKPIGPNGW